MQKKTERLTKKDREFIKNVRFTTSDFAQTIIGCCVFGLPAYINTSFWDYIKDTDVYSMGLFHICFAIVVYIALNYEYASDLFFKKLYIFEFCKRFVFLYISAFFTVISILFIIQRFTFDTILLHVWRDFFAAQTVGIASAVTFSFLKR